MKSQTICEKKYGQFVCGILQNMATSKRIALFAKTIGISDNVFSDEEIRFVISTRKYLATHK